MKYDNSAMRRQDCVLSEEKAAQLLKNSEYGIISMISEENEGYGIPIHFVWDKKDIIYFHGASEGKKLRCLSKNGHISLCIVDQDPTKLDHLTTNFQSVIVKGVVILVENKEEAKMAMELFLEKFSPLDNSRGRQYTENAPNNMIQIYRIDIENITGKKSSEVKDVFLSSDNPGI